MKLRRGMNFDKGNVCVESLRDNAVVRAVMVGLFDDV
jgi:hypothetical protein